MSSDNTTITLEQRGAELVQADIEGRIVLLPRSADLERGSTIAVDAVIKQLEAEWSRAREDLTRAASEGRDAQARWQSAVDREMEASRRYRKAALEGVWPSMTETGNRHE